MSNTGTTTTAQDAQRLAGDMFTQAAETFNRAVETNMHIQQEAAKFWTDFANRQTDEYRTRCERLAEDMMPVMRKGSDRFQKTVSEQTERGLTFVRESFGYTPTGDWKQTSEHMLTSWRKGLDTWRDAVDAFAKAGTDMLQGLTDVAGSGEGRTSTKRPAGK